MTEQELRNIIRKGENQKVEFKLSFGAKAIIAVNALANSQGGYVLLGVSNQGEIAGVNLNEESVQEWLNEIKQKTEPALIPETFQISINNKKIVVLSVSEFPIKPVAFQGRYFARKNNSNHQLSVDDIVEYRFYSLNKSFDAFEVDFLMKDLDQKA